MRKILIASHSNMANGMKDTLEFLTSMDNIYAISGYIDKTPIKEQISIFQKTLDKDDEVIILSDMQGGSVTQEFCFITNDHIHLICGVNLPLALAFVLHPQDEKLTKEKIQSIIEEAQKQIIYMNEFSVEDEEGDE